MKKRNTRRKPVSGLMTGVVFTIVGALCFIPIYYSYFTELTIEKIIVAGVALIISFGMGYFMPSLRDAGFKYYMAVYKKKRERIAKLEKEQEASKNKKPIKKHSLWQKFLYWAFRNGSVAEECAESWRQLQDNEPRYLFLKECKTVQEAVNVHRDIASEMATSYPEHGIYETYHDAEKWQCFDTGFLFFAALSIVLTPLNCFLNAFRDYDFPVILPFVFGILFFAVHIISKGKSKDMAARYLSNIDAGWKMKKEKDNKIFTMGDIVITIGGNTITIEEPNKTYTISQEAVTKEEIEEIKKQLADIEAELKKIKPDKTKIDVVLSKFGKIGGGVLQSALTAIIKSLIA